MLLQNWLQDRRIVSPIKVNGNVRQRAFTFAIEPAEMDFEIFLSAGPGADSSMVLWSIYPDDRLDAQDAIAVGRQCLAWAKSQPAEQTMPQTTHQVFVSRDVTLDVTMPPDSPQFISLGDFVKVILQWLNNVPTQRSSRWEASGLIINRNYLPTALVSFTRGSVPLSVGALDSPWNGTAGSD